MPRTLSTALQTEVANESTKIAFLVKLNLSTVYRLTDFYTRKYRKQRFIINCSFTMGKLVIKERQILYK